MDHTFDINLWRELLEQLESGESSEVNSETLLKLTNYFEHLPVHVAPRLKNEFKSNILKSEKLLSELFDKIDLSDQPLLCILLGLLRSFGFLRISQIAYDIGDQHEFTQIEEVNWFDLRPIIPEAGNIGWDNIMSPGTVDDAEPELFDICTQLLFQKLQFYSIAINLNQFENYKDIIRENASKVVERILDFIRDEKISISLDPFLFQLVSPFSTDEQKEFIIESIVQDLFRSQTTTPCEQTIQLISFCILNQTKLQNLMILKILEHLKCKLISRKRKHNVEALEDNETFENLIDNICRDKYDDLLTIANEHLKITSKKLKSTYLLSWLNVVDSILIQGTLKDHNSLKLLCACSTILVSTSSLIESDTLTKIADLMAKMIDFTGPCKTSKLFKTYDLKLLTELTTILRENTTALSGFDSPFLNFYKLYIKHYLRYAIIKSESEKMGSFVDFACNKNIPKDTSHLLLYVCVHELACCLESKITNKVTDSYLQSAITCGRKLYRLIRNIINSEKNEDENTESELRRSIAFESLVCILRIATVRKNQELLDSYGDIVLNLFDLIATRVSVLIRTARTGTHENSNPLDKYIPKFLTLYKEHSEIMNGYLSCEIISKLANLLVEEKFEALNGRSDNSRKILYNELKSKITSLEERADKSADVYPLIINKQYITVIGDIKKEKPCCRGYWTEMRTLYQVYDIVLTSCDLKIYENVVDYTVTSLEHCDHLDHPKIIFLLMVLESLIPKYQYTKFTTPGNHFDCFRRKMSNISASLIRIAKSVELGPSIHSFTNPGTHKTCRAAQCCTYANSIKIYTQLFDRYPAKWANTLITDALQMCVSSNLQQYAKDTRGTQRFFIQLAGSITGLLKSIFMFKRDDEILKSSMPILLSVLLDLIRCVISAPDDLNPGNDKFESQLKLLALDLAKILKNLSSFKAKLLDYAPHLISTYVKDTQRAPCPDYIKMLLNEGIFRIFNLVDAHQRERLEEIVEAGVQRKTNAGRASGSLFEMIHARLDQASREIFKTMHEDYNRYHRYQGKC